MTKPALPFAARPSNYRSEIPAAAMARWAAVGPPAAEDDDGAVILIYDLIGEDWLTGGGVTAKLIAGQLNKIGDRPANVKVNSPGGDLFEGVAIYNLLREHPGKVTVDVMGLAASAASVIAMAGDTVNVGLGAFLMIHNVWGLVVGDRNDLTEAADLFAGFDAAMADIYAERADLPREEIVALMDDETFLSASEAIEAGFADAVIEAPALADDAKASNKSSDMRAILARRKIEGLLAKAGLTRDERSALIAELKHVPAARDAGQDDAAARDAGFDQAALRQLISTIQP